MSNIKHIHIAMPAAYLKRTGVLLLICATFYITGCKKLVSVDAPNYQFVSSSVFKDSITAQGAVNGLYSQLYNASSVGTSYYSYPTTTEPARLADEMYAVTNSFDDYTNNSLLSNNTSVNALWNNSYNVIYDANSVIAGVQASATLTLSLKQHLTAEAKFLRAFCYFYLVNYFGNIPLVLTTDISVSGVIPQSPGSVIYTQIIADLIDARASLTTDYSWSQGNRTRANYWVATALLARVYLYQGRWAEAEAEASKVIAQSALYSLVPDLNNAFLKNSNESIFSFYTNILGFTYVAQVLTPTSSTVVPTYAIRAELTQAFEPGDARFVKWTNTLTVNGNTYRYPSKYKSITNTGTEYDVVLRLSEQYLIRAEARLQQQKSIATIQSDLNVVRNRAGLANTTAADIPSLTIAIAHERQVELFCEWGHRWLDLKRTNRADVVLRAEKPAGWQATDVLYPIPLTALSTNLSLVQNPGYN